MALLGVQIQVEERRSINPSVKPHYYPMFRRTFLGVPIQPFRYFYKPNGSVRCYLHKNKANQFGQNQLTQWRFKNRCEFKFKAS